MDTAEKIRENRIRRMAERRGLQLQKSRRRDPQAWDYSTYRLIDAGANAVVASSGPGDYGMDLDEIEAWLGQ
jgi:hypothetical protein